MACDLADIGLVESRTWVAFRGPHDTCDYVRCTVTKKRYHSLVLPGPDMVDHIDRDGLNNRRANLRDGGGRVNANNCSTRSDNTSGVVGVHYSEYDAAWVAQWVEGGRRRSRKFKGARDDGAAHRLAVTLRTQKAAALGIHNGDA